ncbi:M2 family metallopeptidase (plasmid) [Priestia megaterium]|uniref:M2 family metallopeptidase n=1 Tax=Priestia megaterium TaxID=1404 RepID=UPI003395426A
MNAESFLVEQNKVLHNLYKDLLLKGWMTTTTGEEGWNSKLQEAQSKLDSYYADSKRFEEVKYLLQSNKVNSIEERELKDLYNNMFKNQLTEEERTKSSSLKKQLVHLFNTFRPKIDEKLVTNNDIRNILSHSQDEMERKKAWIASKQIGKEVQSLLIELVKQRNKEAELLGFKNFYEMSYQTQELDVQSIFELFQRLIKLSDEAYRRIKEEIDEEISKELVCKTKDIKPWYYTDPFFQEAPPIKGFNPNVFYKEKKLEEIADATFESLGLNIKDILNRSDLYPRKDKYPYGYCTNMGRDAKPRVLLNIDSTDFWMSAILHEFGHAVYDKYINKNLSFILRRPSHTLTTEGVAMFFGRMNRFPSWLHRFLGIKDSSIQTLTPIILKLSKRDMLVSMRWYLTFVFFEKELYENPDQDLNKKWWELVEKIQFIKPPDVTHYPDWASKMHFSLAPVSYQNYILGELMASQIKNYIETNLSKDLFNPLVGEYLIKNCFHDGAQFDWNHLIQRMTGELLTPDFFVEEFIR